MLRKPKNINNDNKIKLQYNIPYIYKKILEDGKKVRIAKNTGEVIN